MAKKQISIPNGWEPRPYQRALWNYLENGGLRGLAVAHRRWGKDDVALNWSAVSSQTRVGNYWHMLPEYGQGRKAIWEAVNPHTGIRRIDQAFPMEIREKTRDQEMFIRFRNGSTWQVVGSDSYDSLVGSPPIGVTFSEFAIANPRAWTFMNPILEENKGWALFISTPRGNNHFKNMYDFAKTDPFWFQTLQTVDDTGVFPKDTLARIKNEMIQLHGKAEGEAMFLQEYYCSFQGAIVGGYYVSEMADAEFENRITRVPYDPSMMVTTAWDLGMGDSTGIWFFQVPSGQREIRVIDYLEFSGEGLPFYAKMLSEKPYVYDSHIMPHDIRVRELGTGKSRYEMAEALGIKPLTIARKLPVDDGINAVRALLPKCWFDGDKCKQGIEALKQYRKVYDEKKREFHNSPYHDWTSHGSDAFRYFAVGYKEHKKQSTVSDLMNNFSFRGVW